LTDKHHQEKENEQLAQIPSYRHTNGHAVLHLLDEKYIRIKGEEKGENLILFSDKYGRKVAMCV
jgi:hypothetical protein